MLHTLAPLARNLFPDYLPGRRSPDSSLKAVSQGIEEIGQHPEL